MRGGWKRWRFESGTIRVRVLRKVETRGLDATAVDGIVQDVRGRMLETIKEMGRERTAGLGRKPVAMKANGKEL